MMVVPTLGTLVEVSLREAWNHEAHSFTPWLAENLDNIAKVIGIPLELEGREVAVDTFSADILARNPQDDSLVLIENQLESTDHSHLGQIMTYLAGLHAHTIIWIAADFREAHLSALKWLNENTVEPFSFFAVKVKAVRIGDSQIAPMFEVVGRPNEWERRLQAIAQETRPISSVGQFRTEFWTHYLNRFPDELKHGGVGGATSRWRSLSEIGLAISLYVAQKEVGLFIRGLRGASQLEVFDLLVPHADQLTEITGSTLGSPEQKYFFLKTSQGNTADRGNWDTLADWLHSTADTYESALRAILTEQN